TICCNFCKPSPSPRSCSARLESCDGVLRYQPTVIERQSDTGAIRHGDQRLLQVALSVPNVAIAIDASIRHGLLHNSSVVVSIAKKHTGFVLDGGHQIAIVGIAGSSA